MMSQHAIHSPVLPVRLLQILINQSKIATQNLQIGMPHELLQRIDVHTAAQRPESKRATEGVGVAVRYPSSLPQASAEQSQAGISDPIARFMAQPERLLWPGRPAFNQVLQERFAGASAQEGQPLLYIVGDPLRT